MTVLEGESLLEVLLLAAFTVMAVTLFDQGLSLPWLARALDVPARDPAAGEAGRVSLRQCLASGSVGCCDSSPGQHAKRHFDRTQHPVMQSAEPGEDWRWC